MQRVIDVERKTNEDLREQLAAVKAAMAARVAAQPIIEVRHAHPCLCKRCPWLMPSKPVLLSILSSHAVPPHQGLIELRMECLTLLKHVCFVLSH